MGIQRPVYQYAFQVQQLAFQRFGPVYSLYLLLTLRRLLKTWVERERLSDKHSRSVGYSGIRLERIEVPTGLLLGASLGNPAKNRSLSPVRRRFDL